MEDHSHIDRALGEISQWQTDHQKDDNNAFKEVNARFDLLESNMSMLPTKTDIEEVVRKALLETLFTTGRWTKVGLITAATIIGSIVVISGGLKAVLGWLGFVFMSK